jgi:hypothetical protein
MTWLAWRQHRAEALISGVVLALLVVFLLITGLNIAHTSQQLGVSDCLVHATDRSRCEPLETLFQSQYFPFASLTEIALVGLPPLLLGMLVGAPLVARELEQRTHLLAWTQSVTRARWLVVKLALVLGIGLLVSGVLTALLIWWYGPFDQFKGHFGVPAFDFSGPVLLTSTTMVLALGIFAGALTRRTVLAMFITFALCLAIRLPVEFYLRHYYQPPITVTWPVGQKPPVTLSDHDWLITEGFEDAQGNQINSFRCSPSQTLDQCFQASGITSNYMTYQPADRFWTFQWIETGIYLAFAGLALGAAVWLVRHRLS